MEAPVFLVLLFKGFTAVANMKSSCGNDHSYSRVAIQRFTAVGKVKATYGSASSYTFTDLCSISLMSDLDLHRMHCLHDVPRHGCDVNTCCLKAFHGEMRIDRSLMHGVSGNRLEGGRRTPRLCFSCQSSFGPQYSMTSGTKNGTRLFSPDMSRGLFAPLMF